MIPKVAAKTGRSPEVRRGLRAAGSRVGRRGAASAPPGVGDVDDGDDDPDQGDYPGASVVLRKHGRGRAETDPHRPEGQEDPRDARTGGRPAASARLRRMIAMLPGTVSGALPEPGVHPLVDLVADPLDQPLSDRDVVLAAKFAVRRRRGGDVVPGKLLHGDTIHLDCACVYELPG